jgi:hypothetical protein
MGGGRPWLRFKVKKVKFLIAPLENNSVDSRSLSFQLLAERHHLQLVISRKREVLC